MKFNTLLKPFRFISSLGKRLDKYLSDWKDMAPYHLRLLTESYGGGKAQDNISDFSRREKLIYSWLAMDSYYFGKESTEAARHWIMLGDLHSAEIYPASGRRFYEKAVSILRESSADSRLVKALEKLADCYAGSARLEDARDLHLEIVSMPMERVQEEMFYLEKLMKCHEKLGEFKEASSVNARVLEIAEAGGMKGCLEAIHSYRSMSFYLKESGDISNSNKFREIAEALDWYKIVLSSCGADSRPLKEELRKLSIAFRFRGQDGIVAEVERDIRIIDLIATTKDASFPGVERYLEELAVLLESRNLGGDSTIAFHCRLRAKRIVEKREGFSTLKSILAGFCVSAQSLAEALYLVAYDLGFESWIAVSSLL